MRWAHRHLCTQYFTKFAKILVGSQFFKTRTINNNLNPTFNEFFEAVVDQADGQKLRIELFDEDTAGRDEELGRLSIDLDDVRKRGTVDKVHLRFSSTSILIIYEA